MRKTNTRSVSVVFITALAFALLGGGSAAQAAPILSNGTGGGLFSATGTWQGGSVPIDAEAFSVLLGDAVTYGAIIAKTNNSTVTVSGSLSNVGAYNFTTGAGGANVIVTGNLAANRMITDAAGLDGAMKLIINGGTVTYVNRLVLTNNNVLSTRNNELTLSNNATLTENTDAFFHMFSADADDRAVLTINGPGTFKTRSINVATAVAGHPDPSATATAIRFNFGTAAGNNALACLTSRTSVTLAANALTVDFSAIDRGTYSGSWSTTIVDYASLTGDFGTKTWLGLGAGESASLVRDDANTLFRLDYTLVPEPSSVVCLLGLAAMGYRRRRRQ